MGVDTQLIEDGTYPSWKRTAPSRAAAAGAAGRRSMAATARPVGAQSSSTRQGRGPHTRDVHSSGLRASGRWPPHPGHLRRGGAPRGFKRIELMATKSGEPLYRLAATSRSAGRDARGGEPVPLLRMSKALAPG